jgi:hypothetical protein
VIIVYECLIVIISAIVYCKLAKPTLSAPNQMIALLGRLLRGRLSPPPVTSAFFVANPTRLFFSIFSSARGDFEEALPQASKSNQNDLRSSILRFRFSRRNAAAVLDEWIRRGGKVTAAELRGIVIDLRRARRYEHALDVSISVTHTQAHTISLSPVAYSMTKPNTELLFNGITKRLSGLNVVLLCHICDGSLILMCFIGTAILDTQCK